MLNPLAMMKALKGGIGPDEIAEMLKSMGVDVTIEQVSDDLKVTYFRELMTGAAQPGAKVVKLYGQLKSGESLNALIVVNQ